MLHIAAFDGDIGRGIKGITLVNQIPQNAFRVFAQERSVIALGYAL